MVTVAENSPRYEVLGCIARGTMASLHLARMTTGAGPAQIVVIKRLDGEHTFDKDCVAILSEEARLCGRVRHPNAVGMIDLAIIDGALGLVLEHVAGETLEVLVARSTSLHEPVPPAVAVTIARGVLRGLQAVHEARGDDGAPLPIAHGDVSPRKVLVGTDGKARITDFSLATVREGREWPKPTELLGDVAYMPPEQLLGSPVTEKGDIYAAGVVLWELLAGRRLYACDGVEATSAAVLSGPTAPPSAFNRAVPPELDAAVMRAIAPQAYSRYATAIEFAAILEPWCADEHVVGAWVSALAAEQLASMQKFLRALGDEEERSIESNVSIPGVVRPSDEAARKEGLFERAVRAIFAYTPFAPPSDMRRFQLSLLAGAGVVLLACVAFGPTKGEREATTEEPATEEPALASPAAVPVPVPDPAPPPDPDPVTVVAASPALPEPAAEAPTTPAPVATTPRPSRSSVKASAASTSVSSVAVASTAAAAPTSGSSSSVRPSRRPATSTSTSAPPPATPTAADDPGALKDYR